MTEKKRAEFEKFKKELDTGYRFNLQAELLRYCR